MKYGKWPIQTNGESGRFGLAKTKSGTYHNGCLERLRRPGKERVDLVDRHREYRRCVDSRQPDSVARVAPTDEPVVERRVEHAGDVLHDDPHRVRRERQPADERLHIASADRRNRPVAAVSDRVAQPLLDRSVRTRSPVASLALAECDFGEWRATEPRRGVRARQQPVLHVDEVSLGVGLALERPRQLLALRVLAPHGEVDDGLAVLEEPSTDVRHVLQPSTPPRAVGTATGSRLEHLEERFPRHEHSSADVERGDLAARDRVVRARPGDAKQPGHLVHGERQPLVHRVDWSVRRRLAHR